MIRKALTVLFLAALALSLGGCMEAAEKDDVRIVAKYRAAVESLDHVEQVEVSHKTIPISGKTGSVDIYADTADPETLKALVKDAMQAIVLARGDDSSTHLRLTVSPLDGQEIAKGKQVMKPDDIGYTGPETLDGYGYYLECGIQEGRCP
ncbi:hypothetical protein F8G81_04755 [Arthrobacter sp. CDRTa11]|uniref:hypothetical protein n=1 Tax=Arthrobacter sp. CDRTa11 TaxID=2651199 RepID=UPI00226597D9|nr:hypothetical protein [Arthrobacter sp. CDRTa11]UZX02006.1 hypothetical protein F8G81_04755 [Arthrobacter sp. CDRTa11]